MFNRNFEVTMGIILLVLALGLAVTLFVVCSLNLIPPGRGTVVEVGHHPAFFPEAFCDQERYYIVIENMNGTQSWTWYVDEWYWKRWEVGDKVGVGT